MPYPVTQRSIAYRYDGSFDGFLCCVFESFEKKEMPAAIQEEGGQASLYREVWVDTDMEKAARVFASFGKRIAPDTGELVRLSFLTCAEQKELMLLRFIRKGYQFGKKINVMLADDDVDAVDKAVKFLHNEAHLSTQFLRFSDYGGVLVAKLDPKNFILPLLAQHFSDRFSGEHFMIYDNTHKAALIHKPGETLLVPLEAFTPPPPDAVEMEYRQLWKKFYDTVAIEGRYNPKCRMNHMPKHYWQNMTEFQTSGHDACCDQSALQAEVLLEGSFQTAGNLFENKRLSVE